MFRVLPTTISFPSPKRQRGGPRNESSAKTTASGNALKVSPLFGKWRGIVTTRREVLQAAGLAAAFSCWNMPKLGVAESVLQARR